MQLKKFIEIALFMTFLPQKKKTQIKLKLVIWVF